MTPFLLKLTSKIFKNYIYGGWRDGSSVQRLSVPEDLDPVYSTHIVALNHL